MTEPGSNYEHSALVASTLKRISRIHYVRGWKRVGGLFYRVRFDKNGQVVNAIAVTIGNPGEGDIEVVLTTWDGIARTGWIECKTGQAVQSPEQKVWEKFAVSRGAFYIVVRDPEDAIPLLDELRNRGRNQKATPEKEKP